jgi:hypothetical protein
MNDNLFINLFTYRPRPNRNPLEDFTTECVSYLLQNDTNLLEKYLIMLSSIQNGGQRDNLKVLTQYPMDTGHRVDMAIFWSQNYTQYSIFVEHKVNSLPWEQEDSTGDVSTQIDKYCEYQQSKNSRKDITNFVALVSKFQIKGHSKDIVNRPNYLGNFTWRDVAELINKHIFTLSNLSIISHLEKEFVVFLRRNKMAFENFTLSELGSIMPHWSDPHRLDTKRL